MTDTDTLNLWYEQRRVGELWRNPAGAIGFRYFPEWLDHGFAVSRSLPLTAREEIPGTRWAVFRSVLPSGAGGLQRTSHRRATPASLADF